jgi:hypothetical protein
MSASLRSRPNIGTAAKRRSVPLAAICGAASWYRYSITSSAHFPVSNYKRKLGPADDEMVIARQPLRSKASD